MNRDLISHAPREEQGEAKRPRHGAVNESRMLVLAYVTRPHLRHPLPRFKNPSNDSPRTCQFAGAADSRIYRYHRRRVVCGAYQAR